MAKTAPSPIDVLDFQFKLQCRLKVFENDTHETFKKPCGLVCAASRYGLLFVGSSSPKFQVIQIQDIQNYSVKDGDIGNYKRRYVNLPSNPKYLSVNCDSTRLCVIVEKDGCVKAVIYDISSFLRQNVSIIQEIRLSTTPGVNILDLCWNPSVPSMLVACKDDGSLGLYDLKGNGIEIKELPKTTASTCACWSPKGKQLVVGSANGRLTQYKLDLQVAKSINPPPINGNPHPISVQWISNYQFVAVYKIMGDDVQMSLIVVDAPKTGETSYTNYDDVCYSYGNSRPHQFYMLQQPLWNILLVASSNSMEVGVMKLEKDSWTQWILSDSARAELPLNAIKQETLPVGMGFDTSSIKPLPWGEGELPPTPYLFLLSHQGVLCCFSIVNLKDGAPKLCNPPENLPDRSGLACFTTGQSENVPVQATSSSNLVKPTPVTQTNILQQNIPPFGSNTSSQPTWNFTPPVSITSQKTQQALFNKPTTTVPNLFASQPQQSQQPITKPIVEVKKADSTQEFQMKNDNNQKVLLKTPTVTIQQVKQPQIVEEIPKSPAISIGVPAIDEEKEKLLAEMMKDECVKLDTEIKILLAQGKNIKTDLKNDGEIISVIEGVTTLQEFLKEINETSSTQVAEIHSLRQSMIETWVLYHETQRRFATYKDPTLKSLLLTQPLDAASERKLDEIRRSVYYLESQLIQANAALDDQWDEFQTSLKKQLRSSGLNIEGIYKVMVKQNATLQKQLYLLKDISMRIRAKLRKKGPRLIVRLENPQIEEQLKNLCVEPKDIIGIRYENVLKRKKKLIKVREDKLRECTVFQNGNVSHIVVCKPQNVSFMQMSGLKVMNFSPIASKKVQDERKISPEEQIDFVQSTPLIKGHIPKEKPINTPNVVVNLFKNEPKSVGGDVKTSAFVPMVNTKSNFFGTGGLEKNQVPLMGSKPTGGSFFGNLEGNLKKQNLPQFGNQTIQMTQKNILENKNTEAKLSSESDTKGFYNVFGQSLNQNLDKPSVIFGDKTSFGLSNNPPMSFFGGDLKVSDLKVPDLKPTDLKVSDLKVTDQNVKTTTSSNLFGQIFPSNQTGQGEKLFGSSFFGQSNVGNQEKLTSASLKPPLNTNTTTQSSLFSSNNQSMGQLPVFGQVSSSTVPTTLIPTSISVNKPLTMNQSGFTTTSVSIMSPSMSLNDMSKGLSSMLTTGGSGGNETLIKSTGTSIGVTNSSIGAINKSIGTTNTSIGTTNTSIGTPNTSIGGPNSSIGGPNSSIGGTNTLIGGTNSSIGATNKSIGATNTSIGGYNSSIGSTNTLIGGTNNSIGATNTLIGATNTSIGTTNTSIGETNSLIGATNSSIRATNSSIGGTNTSIRAINTSISSPIGTSTATTPSTMTLTTLSATTTSTITTVSTPMFGVTTTSIFGQKPSIFSQPIPQGQSIFAKTATNFVQNASISTSSSGFGSSTSFGQTTSAPSVGEQAPQTQTNVLEQGKVQSNILEQGKTQSNVLDQGKTPLVNFGQTVSSPSTFGQVSGSQSTTTASGFGQGTSTSTVSSGFGLNVAPVSTLGGLGQTTSTPSVFGQPSKTSNVFEQSTSSSGSVFGQVTSSPSVFGQATTTPSGFGQVTTTPSVFGQNVTSTSTPSAFNQAVTSSTTPTVFGQAVTSTTTSTPSVFGQTGTSTTTPSVFGQNVSSTSTPTVFGQVVTSTSTSTPSVFGQTGTSTTTPSVFGQGVTSTSTPSVFGQTVTSTPSIFGQAVTSTATSTSTPSVFGQTTSTPSVFGQTNIFQQTSTPSVFGQTTSASSVFGKPSTPSFGGTSTNSSVFGQSTFGQQPSSPLFGATSTSSVFGQSTTSTPSVFGQTTSTPAVFGQPTTSTSVFGQTTSTPSVFGQSTTSTPSVFGQTTSTPSVFGQPTTSTSVFGQTTSTPSVFGQPTSTPSVFGQPTTSTQSVFGQPTTSTQSVFGQTSFGSNSIFKSSGSNVFGGSSPFGSTPTTTSAFGSSSPFGSTNVFGGNTSGSVFGKSSFGTADNLNFGGLSTGSTPTTTSSSVFGSSFNVFGSTGKDQSFGTTSNIFQSPTTSTSSVFGGSPFSKSTPAFGGPATFGASPTFSQPSAFGSSFSNTFGNANQSGPFSGGANTQTVRQSGFGSPAAFPKPAFGSPPTFGSQPGGFGSPPTFGGSAFGGSPSFGTGNRVFGSSDGFGAGQQQNSTFANLANQPTIGFGSVAQQAPVENMQQPSFTGGSSFTSWR